MEKTDQVFCQSCGMPLDTPESFGTEKDGSVSGDYCVYCYKDGAFTDDMTMDQMIDFCAQHAGEFSPQLTREEAIAQMKQYFPHLKRWSQAK